jgi:hypothetical protein
VTPPNLTKPNQSESIPGKPLENFLHERFAQALHKRLWAGEKQSTARAQAYRESIYKGQNPDDRALAPNARRLSNLPPVRARLSELVERSATLAAIEAGWIIVQAKDMLDDIDAWNVDDFLTPRGDGTRRQIDISLATREQLARLTELAIEPGKYGTKIKIKGPDRYTARPALLALIGRIGGYEAPKKLAATTKDGEDLSFADVVAEAMALVEAKRAAAKATVTA